MRYYRIEITDPADGKIFVPNVGRPGFSKQDRAQYPWSYCSLNAGATVTSIGGNNPGALCVEMDIAVGLMHLPIQNAWIRVHGISVAEISQSANLNGLNIAVYGGMSKGLPLANPAQSGPLVKGQIAPSFGNWVATNQTLEMTIIVGGSSPSSNQSSGNPSTANTVPVASTNETPSNIVWQWRQGQNFTEAVVNTLSVAYPKYQIVGAVLPNLQWSSASADTGFFATLQQFAQYLNILSLKVIGAAIPDPSKYPGVSVTLQGNQITIGDGSSVTAPKQIQYIDLVGLPTQTGNNLVQITCRMRADINAGDFIRLPDAFAVSPVGLGRLTPGSQSQMFNVLPGNVFSTQKSGSIFTGVFQVTSVRHVGNSRDPDGLSWVTTIDGFLATTQKDAASVHAYPVLYRGSDKFNFYLPN